MKCKSVLFRGSRLLFIGMVLLISAASLPAQKLDMKKLEGMKARNIGPAGMSGRVTAIDVVLKDTDIIYAGTASGGLWKSTNGGIDWKPIFDDQPVASIGAVAIDQSNPSVIWVGTGEGNPRNSQTSGDGVFKSLDGGKTWKFMGLKNSRNIHRILINPHNPDIVYAGVQGSAWGEHPERGVFRTKDGGKTWEKILYVDEKTGIAELVMDPSNPNKLFAAMWQFRRWPWFFESGGPGSGLYVTIDGGDSWEKRTSEDGLPEGDLGRIGIAVAPSNPDRVYALIESKKNALYRSDDGGYKWRKISEKNIGNRPFYYGEIHADPVNENRLYSIHSVVTYSEDGGKTFQQLVGWEIHPDHHAFWVHPQNPDFIIEGNDGGLNISRDRGKTWRFIENLPLAQFYHISVDNAVPYNVLGGMQDNGSWRGPSQVWRAGGIRNAYWEEVAFGDGFDVVPDASDPERFGYAMSQGGFLRRYDLRTGQTRLIKPTHPGDVTLRFNWNAGLAHDPFSKTTIYYGSQFVHKSTDRGETWEIISPDLTTNDPEKQKQLDSGGLTYDVTAAENFCSIVAIEPSPVQEGVIWVGTDDGNLQLTRDGGKTWTNLIGKIKGVPEGTWIPQIRASAKNAGEAFVVFDNHRRNDWTPYVYHTTNFGKSWKRLVDGSKVDGYALAFAQDTIEPRLMFLGTEFGLYVSIDAGATWAKWTNGFPTVSTMDLVIHPREHDLVIGTFGRAAWILDDIRPLREIASSRGAVLNKPVHVFDPPQAIQAIYRQAVGTRFAAHAMYKGENRPQGAMISYVFNPQKKDKGEKKAGQKKRKSKKERGEKAGMKKKNKGSEVTIEIVDQSGAVIRTLKHKAKPGLNRTYWRLDRKGVRSPSQPKPRDKNAREPGGIPVLPGEYKIRVRNGDHVDSTMVTVIFDPRVEVSMDVLKQRADFLDAFMQKTKVVTEAMDRLREARKTIKLVNGRLAEREDDAAKELKKAGKAVGDSIKALMELVLPKEGVQGIRRDPSILVSRLWTVRSYLMSSISAPGQAEERLAAVAEKQMREVVDKINAFFAKDWADYTQKIDAAEVSLYKKYEPLQVGQ